MKKHILCSLFLASALLACQPTSNNTSDQTQSNSSSTSTTADSVKQAMEEMPTYDDTPQKFTIASYNVENLFDTEDDPTKRDEDFTPKGKNAWTSERYKTKLSQIAKVISMIGDEDGAEVIGLVEIENEKVLQDLIKESLIRSQDYKYVHYESPDERGIDVALLYKSSVFEVTTSKNYEIKLEDDKTRDILLVSGKLKGEEVHFLVNHWSSRGGGQEKSEPKRIAAAKTARMIVDELLQQNPEAKIMLMGDFNDEPTDKSIAEILQAVEDPMQAENGKLFNAFGALDAQGKGSYNYKGDWNMIDQMILSKAFAQSENGWHFVTSAIYEPPFLKEQEGKYKGNPFRTYAGQKYLGGYSDHLPIYVTIEK